jgi:hypothetical protein
MARKVGTTGTDGTERIIGRGRPFYSFSPYGNGALHWSNDGHRTTTRTSFFVVVVKSIAAHTRLQNTPAYATLKGTEAIQSNDRTDAEAVYSLQL